ncbi:transposase [Rhodococcus sp. DMU1]|uniref:IS1634 family transposase n=1 Tax=Rhodococcus sp. DMU1 TaxID=2722825 RepID=UPI001FF0C6FC|nr:transposase [Rhodococcus sp. DMU1]
MVIAADAGMLSATNLKDLDAAGLKFIVGSRVTKAPADLASHFHWNGDVFTDGQIIFRRDPTARQEHGQRHRSPRRAGVGADRHVGVTGDLGVLGHACRAGQPDPERAGNPGPGGHRRHPHHPHTAVRQDHHEGQIPRHRRSGRARSLIGLKGYVTNLPVSLMNPREVMKKYHDLWHVEQSFRMSKTDLRARPIFSHTRESIEAHLTIVFTALAISRYLQDATGISIRKIVRTLRPLQEVTVTIAGHEHTAFDPLTDDAVHILDSLGIANPRSRLAH